MYRISTASSGVFFTKLLVSRKSKFEESANRQNANNYSNIKEAFSRNSDNCGFIWTFNQFFPAVLIFSCDLLNLEGCCIAGVMGCWPRMMVNQ